MKTSTEYYTVYKVLQCLTIMVIVILNTVEPKYVEKFFKQLPNPRCINSRIGLKNKTASITECALYCMSDTRCGYFNYCNGKCILYKRWYSTKLVDYDCDCTSYLMLYRKSTDWQKVFVMRKTFFVRNPFYLHWDSMPIAKVRLSFSNIENVTQSLNFNGTDTNHTSWFQEDKLLSTPWRNGPPMKYIFNEVKSFLKIVKKANENDIKMLAERVGHKQFSMYYMEQQGNSLMKLQTMNVFVLFK
ncbi:uncharacterized protein LOC106876623 [Octopus bimaculoides]|uniref:Apple domain-containing protein n=1 Tax=Octopus bimaculoides TaxID=37653 RepID=A0A0L8GIU2_OCTBM|nr:uncharacterized protein LOC106876623 [Octopus bimaculoides]|eukprot:XP_014780724.1 PREDICTED: uncharacterized protein LOC106876623 [Octopus bimaculoides]